MLFLDFIRLVTLGEPDAISRELALTPSLAKTASEVGASRSNESKFFFTEIAHYLYAGDTALHMAAAAFRRQVIELLIAHGADSRAKNRRGAEPLHYAVDTNRWKPEAQVETIRYLLMAGADPNATDMDGVTPLHRAVRTRSAPAVQALLEGGANPTRRNKRGSTPMQVATKMTGRGGSGTERAREQQVEIIRLLVAHGAEGRTNQ
jgi:ankyrin repeat protein